MRLHIALVLVASLACVAQAQWLSQPTPVVARTADGRPDLSAPAPRMADGKPDFSGIWEAVKERVVDQVRGTRQAAPEFLDIAGKRADPLPYLPWARDIVQDRAANNGKDNPSARCLPLGMVMMHSGPYPRKILQLPGLVVILYEQNMEYRQIFTDGRALPRDPQPAFNGYSSGEWLGDTLVVQTIGIRNGLWLDARGNPITESAKITERIRRPNFGNLEIELTIDDPSAYTRPWTVMLNHAIRLDTELMEYVCLENEKDVSHLVGK